MSEQLLAVSGLEVRLEQGKEQLRLLEGISFEVRAGEAVGVVGESGAGKTTLVEALVGLAAPGARIGGSVRFEGRELVGLAAAALRSLRGSRIGVLLQEAAEALHPQLSVGRQLDEALRAHGRLTRRERVARASALLAELGLGEWALGRYPHQLSGGQRQRVALAQALAHGPALLIADEPTAGLDPTLARGLIALLAQLRARSKMALLVVTHDPALVSGLLDRALVLYAGRLVERGRAAELFARPAHPYTWALSRAARRATPALLPGPPPNPADWPTGCRLHPRCPFAFDRCRVETPQLRELATGGGRAAACHLEEDQRWQLLVD